MAAPALVLVLVLAGCAPQDSPWKGVYSSLDTGDLVKLAAKVVACMADRGFPGWSAEPDGSVASTSEISPEQGDVVRENLTECRSAASGLSLENPTLPRAAREELYQLELQAAACLRRLGLHPSDPPSEQTYVEQWGTAQAWSAAGSVVDEQGAHAALSHCPDPNWFVGLLPKPPVSRR